jgi:DNA mismatch repair ATPase MutS
MERIQDIVNAKVRQMVDGGIIKQAIEDGVEKAVCSAVADQFKSYGDIAKTVKAAIKEGLRFDKNEVPFETYNQQMLVAIKQRLGIAFADAAAGKFLEEIDNILEPAPREITLKNFAEKMAELWKESLSYYDKYHDDLVVNFKDEDSLSEKNSLCSIKFTATTGHRFDNNDEIKLFLIDGKIRINHKHKYNPTCFSAHEAYVFKLYAAGTIITDIESFDPGDCDLTLRDVD